MRVLQATQQLLALRAVVHDAVVQGVLAERRAQLFHAGQRPPHGGHQIPQTGGIGLAPHGSFHSGPVVQLRRALRLLAQQPGTHIVLGLPQQMTGMDARHIGPAPDGITGIQHPGGRGRFLCRGRSLRRLQTGGGLRHHGGRGLLVQRRFGDALFLTGTQAESQCHEAHQPQKTNGTPHHSTCSAIQASSPVRSGPQGKSPPLRSGPVP